MHAYTPTIPPWMVQVTTLPEAGMHGAHSSELCTGYAIADAVYGTRKAPGLVAFAYLWRRFGPPWWGADPHKDLAQYVLGTPHPEVVVTLALNASDLRYGVGYLITPAFDAAWRQPLTDWEQRFEAWWLARKTTTREQQVLGHAAEHAPATLHAIHARFVDDRCAEAIVQAAEGAIGPYPRAYRQQGSPVLQQALHDALVELLRPVYVHDVPITILGRIPKEAAEDAREQATRSRYAGYGVPYNAMEQWITEEER
jgi:hypothetical protein